MVWTCSPRHGEGQGPPAEGHYVTGVGVPSTPAPLGMCADSVNVQGVGDVADDVAAVPIWLAVDATVVGC